MKVTRGYKTELDPTSEQYVLFCQCSGSARFAYNYGLARKKDCRDQGSKAPSAIDLQKELTARKHDDLLWLQPLSKWVVQNALRDLDTAFDNFFRKCKLKKQGKFKGKCGYPRFKSKRRGRGGFRLDTPISDNSPTKRHGWVARSRRFHAGIPHPRRVAIVERSKSALI